MLSLRVSFCVLNITFLLVLHLSVKKGLFVFQGFLFQVTSFMFRFQKNVFLVFCGISEHKLRCGLPVFGTSSLVEFILQHGPFYDSFAKSVSHKSFSIMPNSYIFQWCKIINSSQRVSRNYSDHLNWLIFVSKKDFKFFSVVITITSQSGYDDQKNQSW